MRKGIFTVIVVVVCTFSPLYCAGDDNAVTTGFGFGIFNRDPKFGKLRGDGRYYYFYQVAYAREKTLVKNFCLLVEPFAAYVNDPQSGLDAGMTMSFKYYFAEDYRKSFFATLGTGAAYTTIAFEEQGTHFLFILQGGVGYRWNNYFIENRFRHYSNGGTERPNRSVNANIVNIGMHF
ncbi:MAG: Lipid A 3-O-deacylase (PagL) [Syntrophorhabdus sp. PtaU1.Bin058]|nr:MAG: Lipid A 3-O-deacylase (PagL) [Syntrophorhabdus sp. PtaU1.Bin058]